MKISYAITVCNEHKEIDKLSNAANIISFIAHLVHIYRSIDKRSVNEMYKNNNEFFKVYYGKFEDIKKIRLKNL